MISQKMRLAVFAVTLVTLNGTVFGRTNKDDVQQALKDKHVKVVFGKEIDHLEYVKVAASLSGGPAGASAYLKTLTAAIVKETGGQIAAAALKDLLTKGKSEVVIKGKHVYAGIATYNHWTEEKYPKFDRGRLKWGKIRVSRPNTHQFYVAFGKK